MKRYLLLAGLGLLGGPAARAQATPKATYLQIFYEGAGWLAGRPLLHYSPALRGKSSETVTEPDSIQSISPGTLAQGSPPKEMVAMVSQTGQQTTYLRGQDGKLHLQPPTSEKQKQAQQARFLNLLDARATLARNALTAALNSAAADGWEVVQVATWGGKDGLVYLLRHR